MLFTVPVPGNIPVHVNRFDGYLTALIPLYSPQFIVFARFGICYLHKTIGIVERYVFEQYFVYGFHCPEYKKNLDFHRNLLTLVTP